MTIDEILKSVPDVSGRNYWMVRADGGNYYNSFLAGGFVAINYDAITLEEVGKVKNDHDQGVLNLAAKIANRYPDEKREKHAARQIIKFVYEIKKGDIVMVPSESSEYIAFVEVLQSHSYNEFDNKFDCPYVKRKKIKLLRIVARDRLDPNLYKLMFSHHTITEADGYQTYIDKILNGFFVKDENAHIVLEVETTDEIKARQLFKLGDSTLDLFEDFCKEEGLDFNADDFDIKLAVQSPGFLEISGAIVGVLILGLILVSITGGGFGLKVKGDVDASLKTDGLIDKIKDFLNSRDNARLKKQIVEKALEDMKIKEPDELVKIMKEFNKK